jgi:chromate reductase, NAD(P)H dehydrogenase (quinone)
MSIRVAAFSGSLRRQSYTTKLIQAFQKLAPATVKVKIVEIGRLPLLNQDIESDLPASVRELHGEIEGADAVLLATPEYNRSYSPWTGVPDPRERTSGKESR